MRNFILLLISLGVAILGGYIEKELSGHYPSYFQVLIMTFVLRIYLSIDNNKQ